MGGCKTLEMPVVEKLLVDWLKTSLTIEEQERLTGLAAVHRFFLSSL